MLKATEMHTSGVALYVNIIETVNQKRNNENNGNEHAIILDDI